VNLTTNQPLILIGTDRTRRMTEPTPTTSQVRVGVRVRPLASKEIQQGGKISPAVVPPSISIGQRKFTYDDVFDSNVEQAELYDNVSTPLLKSFVDGYNATVRT
jgi:kinesin family protein 15